MYQGTSERSVSDVEGEGIRRLMERGGGYVFRSVSLEPSPGKLEPGCPLMIC
jgi:hypothetical protein